MYFSVCRAFITILKFTFSDRHCPSNTIPLFHSLFSFSRYFHGGPLEEGGGSGSVYSIITYRAADCHPGIPVATFGPYTCPQTVVETVDKIQ